MKQMRKLWLPVVLCCAGIVCAPNPAHAQDSNDNLPDSPSFAPHHGGPNDNFASNREVSWRSVPRDFLHDQKAIWLAPTQLAKGRGWVPLAIVAGGTAGLIYADPHAMPYFRDHAKNIDKLNDVFDPTITTAEVVALPASLLAAGYIRHDSYQVGTAILCAEAYGDSAIVDLAVKAITRRERPSDVPTGSFDNTFFLPGPASPLSHRRDFALSSPM